MSASVVNQAYSQQVNQAFDLFKTFTPQQMQQMGQQVAQKPNSPEAVAFASAAQYQQQMRAPQPQAPQGTIFQQKLQEFQQTSPQGLPSVGGNQMAMQQAAQQDPMRNAGIGAAPENMPAPAPQPEAPQEEAQAATGGLVALAHGGEVRHFDQGGLGSLTKYLSQGVEDPNQFDDAAFNMDIGTEEELPVKTKVAPVGKDDILFAPADTSSAARNEAAPTYRERKDAIKELLGAPEDYSEEVGMAKEAVANANRDKKLGALAQGIGGMLSAQTPYMSQALGAGLMSGVSGYSQGAKDESSAQKDLMALQMAHKKALVSGDKEAATMLLSNMAEQDKAVALAKSKRQDLADKFGYDVQLKNMEGVQGLTKQEVGANQAIALKEFEANNAQLLEKVKADLDIGGGLKPQHRSAIYNALVADQGADNAAKLFPVALEIIMKGATPQLPLGALNQMQPLGNSNTGYSVSKPTQ
tara:strand:+ start:5878 stop:7284 length:1407 start_codon:yes stop_codon:yes gene_type:complete